MIKLNYKDIELDIEEETKTAYLYGTYLSHTGVGMCCMKYSKIEEVETLYVMDGVNTIEPWFLNQFKGLEKLFLADSITSINDENCFSMNYSFMGCKGLDYLKLPAGIHRLTSEMIPCAKEVYVTAAVTEIDNYAFSGKYRMQNIIVDEDNQDYRSIDGVLFTKDGRTLLAFPCARTGTYIIPEETKEIGKGAFQRAEIDKVVLHNDISVIDDNAFKDCKALTSVQLPDNLRKLSSTAFEGCENIDHLDCGKSCRNYSSINNVLYTDENREIVAVPKSTAGEFTIPEGVMTLGGFAFSHCHITKVVIPETVCSIKWCCFYNCKELREVIFKGKRSIPYIEEAVFADCDNLKIIRIYSEDAGMPQKLCYGKKPGRFSKQSYDEVFYAPNVMLSQVAKDYMPTVAAGFADMMLNGDDIPVFIYQHAEKYMKDHVEELYEKAFNYIRLLEYLLYKEFIPVGHAIDLLKVAENYEDKRISQYLQEYIIKHPAVES